MIWRVYLRCFLFFFFKQKTAYEMRISDWSSDVCSSDLLGTRRVKDVTRADATKLLKDVMAGKTRSSVKTDKLRGKSIVRGGAGTASRTLGLFGALLTYAINAGIIDSNPAHGIRKPKDQVRQRSEAHTSEIQSLMRISYAV